MLKKRVKIFKWTAPMWTLLLAAVLVVAAFAWGAFLISYNMTGNVGTETPIVTEYSALACIVETPGLTGAPVITSCVGDMSTGVATVNVDNLSPGAEIRLDWEPLINDTFSAICTITPPAESFVSLVDVQGTCGVEQDPSTFPRMRFLLTFNEDLPEGAAVSFPFSVVWDYYTP